MADRKDGPHIWFPCTHTACLRKVAVSREIYELVPERFPLDTRLPCPAHIYDGDGSPSPAVDRG